MPAFIQVVPTVSAGSVSSLYIVDHLWFCLLYRINFFRSLANIIDLLATGTFYVDLLLSLLQKENDLSEMINLIQVARLFRLTRHSPGLKVGIFGDSYTGDVDVPLHDYMPRTVGPIINGRNQ